MKLEVGMYVRTYDGINKVTKINEHRGTLYYEFEKPFEVEFLGEDILKASFNLIDLIEVGDFVNDEKVLSIKEDNKLKLVYVIKYIETSESFFTNDKIKSILTHEQYEANAYKVGE